MSLITKKRANLNFSIILSYDFIPKFAYLNPPSVFNLNPNITFILESSIKYLFFKYSSLWSFKLKYFGKCSITS